MFLMDVLDGLGSFLGWGFFVYASMSLLNVICQVNLTFYRLS